MFHREGTDQANSQLTDSGVNSVCTANVSSGILQLGLVMLSDVDNLVDTLAVCDTGSTLPFTNSGVESLLDIDETKLTLSVAGNNGRKKMTSAKVGVKVPAKNRDEGVTFHVHPNMYLGNRRHVYSNIKQKRKYLKALQNRNVDLQEVEVVLGPDNFHLHFPLSYGKGRRNEFWAVKINQGWTISGSLQEHEIAQIATTFSASDHDQVADQLKMCWSSET